MAWSRADVLMIVAIGFVTLLLRQVPLLRLVLYPFWLFNTFIHEFAHVFALGFTGRRFRGLVVDPNRSGSTHFVGRQGCIGVSAGYVGTALFGGFLIMLTTADLSPRAALLLIGVLFGVLCICFVSNCFGLLAGLCIAVGLCVAGSYLPEEQAALVLLFLAVQTILASFDSLFVLVRIACSGQPHQSDAEIMEDLTAIPALFWAVAWCVLAVLILVWSVTVAYR
jgi:hypothetical protein